MRSTSASDTGIANGLFPTLQRRLTVTRHDRLTRPGYRPGPMNDLTGRGDSPSMSLDAPDMSLPDAGKSGRYAVIVSARARPIDPEHDQERNCNAGQRLRSASLGCHVDQTPSRHPRVVEQGLDEIAAWRPVELASPVRFPAPPGSNGRSVCRSQPSPAVATGFNELLR